MPILNWKRDLPSLGDKKYAMHVESASKVVYPSKVDLRPLDAPVFDQGEIGSCSANAGAGAAEFLELQEMRAKAAVGQELFDPKTFAIMSRLYLYYNERVLDGDVSQDAGSTLRSCMLAIQNYGMCKESTWPYGPNWLYKRPSAFAYNEGKAHKETHHYRLQNLEDMKRCLMHGFPFVFGIAVYDSFLSEEVAANGVVPMPNPDYEAMQGGHALLCVGYDDAMGVFIFKNSWGQWADKGYGYLPYAYMTNPELAADFWTLRRS